MTSDPNDPQQPGGQPPPPASPAPGPAGPPQPAPTPAASQVGQPAELGPRVLAKVIDSLIVGVVVAPIWVVLGIGMSIAGLPGVLQRLITYTLATALYIGYFAYLESNKGQTLGKMVVKLEVRAASGGYPTMEEAVKRNAYFGVMLVGIIPFIGWLLYPLAWVAVVVFIMISINNTATRQGWHDMFAGGTKVLKTA